jgi:hypothetical protein
VERAVDRALVRDLDEARPLRRVEIAGERDAALDVIDLAVLGLALGAIGRVMRECSSSTRTPSRGRPLPLA